MVIAFAMVAAACGGDDGDEGNDASGNDVTTTTLAAPTGEPIVIFSSRNIEGGQSSFGPQSYGFIAGIQAQNKRGGIQGRPLQADFCDGHSNANDEKACMQQGFDTGTVVAANTIYRRRPVRKPAASSTRWGCCSSTTSCCRSSSRRRALPTTWPASRHAQHRSQLHHVQGEGDQDGPQLHERPHRRRHRAE